MARSEEMERAALTAFSIAFSPVIVFFSFAIAILSLGIFPSARKLYIKVLLRIFEWGRIKIENHERVKSSHLGYSDKRTISESLDISLDQQGDNAGFHLSDPMDFCKNAIQTIVDDEVTKRFDAAELSSWNLLTRTNANYQFISLRLTVLWMCGFITRYLIFFPARFLLAVFGILFIIVGTCIIGYLPEGRFKRWTNVKVSMICFHMMMLSFGAIIKFHNPENRAKSGGICVANHTSPIDIIILGSDNCYAMIGQTQGGLMGLIQRAMCRAESHIFFQRSEVKDRLAVGNRLREHVNSNRLPILIFPEGTCINNTSIMMFKKGSFEGGGIIYPAAIKYDPRFADPFWNSSETSLSTHMLMILTSWALVVDVWYLPPEMQKEDETSVQFANRVKANIARMGGLVDLEWDGGLKRSSPKPSMKKYQQEVYSKNLKHE